MPRPTRRITAAFILVGLAALAFAVPATAGGRPFTTSLTGAAERPEPGDPDATGSAFVTVNPGARQVCWSVSVEGVDLPLVAAHIHTGNVNVAGPPTIFLIPAGEIDADGMLDGCANVDRTLALGLIVHPEDYYVNVHTALFPAGAARGQLG